MTWRGLSLEDHQRELMIMLDNVATDNDVVLSDDSKVVGELIAKLAALGVWTLGVAEKHGGGGADRSTTTTALIALSRSWPAIALSAVQAHVAAEILAGDGRCDEIVPRIHAGTAAVAVVDAGSARVKIEWTGSALRGSVDRVDAAAMAPYLLVLSGDDSALLIDPSAYTPRSLRRTGLGGAFTRSLELDAPAKARLVLTDVDVVTARACLRSGIAAVAAGIAAAAADAAFDYANERYQFGDRLTAIPIVRQSLLAQAERTSVLLDTVLAGVSDDPVRSLATVREACAGAIEVAAAALQSHGGYGYLVEYPAERYFRDAVSLYAAADLSWATVAEARVLAGLAPIDQFVREVW